MTNRARALQLSAAVASFCASTLMIARPAAASGFLIYDISGQAMARASAVSADDDEPAAVWFNPATLAFMKGVGASAGGVFLTSKSRFSPAGGGADTNSERGNYFLPTVFANALLTDRVAIGMGAYSTFGIGIAWPDGWVGRESAIKASLQSLALNPTVAVKLHSRFALGVGFDAIRSVVDFTNGLPSLIGGDVRIAGGTWGYGFNVAALYKVIPRRLQVALTYRSRVKLDFTGRAKFTPANPDFAPELPDQGGTASITLPDIITVGVMGRPRWDLALTFDANVVLWSTYDRININFDEAPDRAIVSHGQNTFTLRAGADWIVAADRLKSLHLRGGLIYDHGAIEAANLGPGLPDSDRIDVGLGVGYGYAHARADLGYLLVVFLPADANGGREGPEGTYNSMAHLVGLTVSLTWP